MEAKESNGIGLVVGILLALGLAVLALMFIPYPGLTVVKTFWNQRKAVCLTPFGLKIISFDKPEIVKANRKYVLRISVMTVEHDIVSFITLEDKAKGTATDITLRTASKTTETENYASSSGGVEPGEVNFS